MRKRPPAIIHIPKPRLQNDDIQVLIFVFFNAVFSLGLPYPKEHKI